MKFSNNTLDESILAFTASLRCGPGYPRYSYEKSYRDFAKQLECLITNHGFGMKIIHEERYSSVGKGKNMWFICLKVNKLRVPGKSIKYVDNPVYRDEFLGFRPGTILWQMN